MNPQAKAQGGKVSKVMREFGSGKLRSSSGQKVTNPKQAIAIALSEQRRGKGMQTGGAVPKLPADATPSPTERERMRQQAEQAKRDAAEKAAAEKTGTTTKRTMGVKPFARGGLTPGMRFDKAVGTDRKMGADYVKADRKQDRFMRGSSTEAKINRQDTRHGKVDMPFSKLNKYAGMKQGGVMRVRKYNGEEGSYIDGRPFAETEATEERTTTRRVDGDSSGSSGSKSSGSADFKRAFAKAMADSKETGAKSFEYKGKSYALQYAKPSKDMGDESERMHGRAPRTETTTETVRTPAVTGRADKASKNMPSEEQKAENTSRFAKGVGAALSMVPVGRAVQAGVGALKAGRVAKDAAELSKMGKANEARFAAKQAAERAAARREARYDAQRASDMEAGFRKGGIMKGYAKGGESKAMMKKEVEFMKKKGAPKSMIKHEMAEAKGKGYARGGGIERRGSGKGTVVKMAGGGYVRSADGVAKKGKTKGRMC